jgi:hypothetical protein
MKHALSKPLEGRAASEQIPRNTTMRSGRACEACTTPKQGRGDR